jgi:hypothetical protein
MRSRPGTRPPSSVYSEGFTTRANNVSSETDNYYDDDGRFPPLGATYSNNRTRGINDDEMAEREVFRSWWNPVNGRDRNEGDELMT